MYFGRQLALTDRNRVARYALPQRAYIGPTSMDCEMAFIMANMGKVCLLSCVCVCVCVCVRVRACVCVWPPPTPPTGSCGRTSSSSHRCVGVCVCEGLIRALRSAPFRHESSPSCPRLCPSQVRRGHLVLDPYAGTGSILVAAAAFGAQVMGTDIDIRVSCRPPPFPPHSGCMEARGRARGKGGRVGPGGQGQGKGGGEASNEFR